MGRVPINENQKCSIGASLRLLDEALCLFDEYARGREVRSVFFVERNGLTARQRKKLLLETERIRRRMAEIKEALGLSTQVLDVRRRIWGHGAGFWEVLAEMEARRLRAYGPVGDELAAYIDPMSRALQESMSRISGIVGSDHRHLTVQADGQEAPQAPDGPDVRPPDHTVPVKASGSADTNARISSRTRR